MAQLSHKFYPMPEFRQFKDWKEWSKAQDEALDAIPAGRLISFPCADGQALYYVETWKPFVLQSIPYGDAWQVPYYTIRGFTVADAK